MNPTGAIGPPAATRSAWDAVGGDGPTRALIALGLVSVLLGALVGWLWWTDHRNSQTAAARQEGLRSAREQVVPVLSYDFRSLEEDLRRARASLTGSYRDEFTAQVHRVQAPAARAQQVSTQARVLAAGVVRASPDQAVVLLFVNQSTRSSRSPAVRLSAHRIELTMTLVDGRWLISGLTRV